MLGMAPRRTVDRPPGLASSFWCLHSFDCIHCVVALPEKVRFKLACAIMPKECAPESQKSPKRVKNLTFGLFSDSFETPGRTLRLWAFWGPCPGVLFSDSFRTLPGFRARRARETLCGAGPIAIRIVNCCEPVAIQIAANCEPRFETRHLKTCANQSAAKSRDCLQFRFPSTPRH